MPGRVYVTLKCGKAISASRARARANETQNTWISVNAKLAQPKHRDKNTTHFSHACPCCQFQTTSWHDSCKKLLLLSAKPIVQVKQLVVEEIRRLSFRRSPSRVTMFAILILHAILDPTINASTVKPKISLITQIGYNSQQSVFLESGFSVAGIPLRAIPPRQNLSPFNYLAPL